MSKISSGTTTATGLVQTSDTTGNLELQTNNGTTAVTFDTNQNASFAGDVSINNGNYLSSQPTFRNLIINGDMRIAQRGTSSTSLGYYTVDRYYNNLANTDQLAITQSQSTDTPSTEGFSNSFKNEATTAESAIDADDLFNFANYIIEAQDCQHLKYGTANAVTTTLSFWVKSSVTGTYVVGLYIADSSRLRTFTYTISSANTWEKKTITITGDTVGSINNDNGAGIRLIWIGFAGSNWNSTNSSNWINYVSTGWAYGHTATWGASTSDTFYLTGIQLEVGDTATPFEHRPWHIEKYLCERYCQTTYPYGTAPGTNIGFGGCIGRTGLSGVTTTGETYLSTQFKQQMRASPTILFYDVQGNVGKVTGTQYLVADYHNITASVGASSANGFAVTQNGGGTFGGISYHYLVTAEL